MWYKQCHAEQRIGYTGMWLMLTSLLSPASLQLDHGKVGLQ